MQAIRSRPIDEEEGGKKKEKKVEKKAPALGRGRQQSPKTAKDSDIENSPLMQADAEEDALRTREEDAAGGASKQVAQSGSPLSAGNAGEKAAG